MRSKTAASGFIRFSSLVFGLSLAAAPASAQWSRLPAIPLTDVVSLRVNADTIVAGVDTAAYVSVNAGASWKRTARPGVAANFVQSSWIRNGRLYVGTTNKGVFTSDDFGTTWQPFSQGLVGGIEDSQLDVGDLQARGDSLYAATYGAGVYVRNLAAAGTWHHFGEEFEPAQASNVNDLALGGNRLLASAGGNGTIFRRDPGEAGWTESFLDNAGLAPGVMSRTVAWTGTAWLVGTTIGVFRSDAGQEPWTLTGPDLGPLGGTSFAIQSGTIFAAFFAAIDHRPATVMASSEDDGRSWQVQEIMTGILVYQLALVGNRLYAARGDGLWVRPIQTASVPPGGEAASSLRFSLAGAQPVGDDVRLRFELREAGSASIDVFDVSGRRVGDRIQDSFTPGSHEVSWSARGLSPGIYAARLSAGGRSAVVRLVRVR